MSIFRAKFECLILSKLVRSNQAPCLPSCRVTTRGSSLVLRCLMASLLLGDGIQGGKLYIKRCTDKEEDTEFYQLFDAYKEQVDGHDNFTLTFV